MFILKKKMVTIFKVCVLEWMNFPYLENVIMCVQHFICQLTCHWVYSDYLFFLSAAS